MHSRSIVLGAVLTAALAACDGGGAEPIKPTFQNVVNTVLKPSCVFGSCHAIPNVAAKLDLTGEKACNALHEKPSCLFPDRMRVVPGKPEESYFFHKLTGEGLDVPPATNCGDTNFIMPWGAAALPAEQIELVREWILDGAECELKPEPPPPDDGKPAVIAGISTNREVPIAGEPFMITVALNKGAPAEGQLVTLRTDSSLLSVPMSRVISAGETKWEFEAYALRPMSRFALHAETGQDPNKSTKQLILRIGGLDIAEVMADPMGIDDERQWIKLHNRTVVPIDLSNYGLKAGATSYDSISVPLSGMLAAGKCVLIGGPKPAGPGAPPYTPQHDFEPDLPHVHMAGEAAGFALFDSLPGIDGVRTPVDALIVGSGNNSRFRGPDGGMPAPYCLTPAADQDLSIVRTGAAACVASATPKPSACP